MRVPITVESRTDARDDIRARDGDFKPRRLPTRDDDATPIPNGSVFRICVDEVRTFRQ